MPPKRPVVLKDGHDLTKPLEITEEEYAARQRAAIRTTLLQYELGRLSRSETADLLDASA
jgi:hypothetical protein